MEKTVLPKSNEINFINVNDEMVNHFNYFALGYVFSMVIVPLLIDNERIGVRLQTDSQFLAVSDLHN